MSNDLRDSAVDSEHFWWVLKTRLVNSLDITEV